MNIFETKGLQFHYCLAYNFPKDELSLCFIPTSETLHHLEQKGINPHKIVYELCADLEENFCALRDKIDFAPIFKNELQLFEVSIVRKNIGMKEASLYVRNLSKAA